MKNKEIIDTSFIRGLQNFDNYDSLNPIEIKIEWNSNLEYLHKSKNWNYKFRFLFNGILFSLRIKSNTKILFINFNSLNDANDLMINRKMYNSLSVIHLDQIKIGTNLKVFWIG